MQIQRLVDLEDYEFDTLLVTYNHKNRSEYRAWKS